MLAPPVLRGAQPLAVLLLAEGLAALTAEVLAAVAAAEQQHLPPHPPLPNLSSRLRHPPPPPPPRPPPGARTVAAVGLLLEPRWPSRVQWEEEALLLQLTVQRMV